MCVCVKKVYLFWPWLIYGRCKNTNLSKGWILFKDVMSWLLLCQEVPSLLICPSSPFTVQQIEACLTDTLIIPLTITSAWKVFKVFCVHTFNHPAPTLTQLLPRTLKTSLCEPSRTGVWFVEVWLPLHAEAFLATVLKTRGGRDKEC